ncbi:hypothetical protein D3C72_1374310 [compost metagenome]
MLAAVWSAEAESARVWSATWLMAAIISSMLALVSPTLDARLSALPATRSVERSISLTDCEVSSTAWPVTSAAVETASAERRTWPTMPRRLSSIRANDTPSWSRSLIGVTRRLRSPWLSESETSAMPCR